MKLFSLLLVRLLVVTVAIAFTACGGTGDDRPKATRTAPPAIPTYPNAQQETMDPGWAKNSVLNRTFLTPDDPETVFAFYREQFTEDGWEIRRTAVFENRQACPVYVAKLSTRQLAGDMTQVYLQVGKEECYRGH